jgi:hypothetical protein
MGKRKTITGVVSYHEFGMGFWGITDAQGNEWRPVRMPDQLKVKGATVTCTIQAVKEDVSIHMWGKPVEIISFHTPGAGKER